MTADITPFAIDVPQTELDDLAERLRRTRWAEAETVDDWSQGIPLSYTQELCGYWADGYDWRAREKPRSTGSRSSAPRSTVSGIHFLHVRSPHEDALPLVISHGWPGSIVEFHKVIEPLTDPTAHGGDALGRVPRRRAVAARVRLQRQADRARLGRATASRTRSRASWPVSATTATRRRAATGGR